MQQIAPRWRQKLTKVLMISPILPEKVEAWRRIWQALLGSRRDEYARMCVQLGIERERAWLLHIPGAPVAVVAIEAEYPEEGLHPLREPSFSLDEWLRLRLCDLHDIDLLDWRADIQAELLFET